MSASPAAAAAAAMTRESLLDANGQPKSPQSACDAHRPTTNRSEVDHEHRQSHE